MTAPVVPSCAPRGPGPTLDDAAAADVAAVLRAAADPLRLRMLAMIAANPSGEACVCDLAEIASVGQPTVSHHLKVLRDAGVLLSDRRGTWVHYRIAPAADGAVRAVLDSVVPAVLARGSHRPEPSEELS